MSTILCSQNLGFLEILGYRDHQTSLNTITCSAQTTPYASTSAGHRFCSRSCTHAQSLGCVLLFVTPWTIAREVPLFMGFSRPEYWSGQPFPSPGDLPNQRIEPRSPTLQVDSLPAEPQWKPKNTGVGTLYFLQGIFPA